MLLQQTLQSLRGLADIVIMVIKDIGNEEIAKGSPRLDEAGEKGIGSVTSITLATTCGDVSHDGFDRGVGTDSENGVYGVGCACSGDETEAGGNTWGDDRNGSGRVECAILGQVKKDGMDEIDGFVGEVAICERGDVRDEDEGGRLGGGDGGGEVENAWVVVRGRGQAVYDEDGAGVRRGGQREGRDDVGLERGAERKGERGGERAVGGDGEVETKV